MKNKLLKALFGVKTHVELPTEPRVKLPPKGRIPFIGWLDLEEIKIRLNFKPTEDGYEMIPQGHTAKAGDEAYVESYTDEGWWHGSNLNGWYPVPDGINEKWLVVGGPCMRMARRKITQPRPW